MVGEAPASARGGRGVESGQTGGRAQPALVVDSSGSTPRSRLRVMCDVVSLTESANNAWMSRHARARRAAGGGDMAPVTHEVERKRETKRFAKKNTGPLIVFLPGRARARVGDAFVGLKYGCCAIHYVAFITQETPVR